MATNQYPYLQSVQSTLVEDQIAVEVVPPSPNAILILGTAVKGPLYTPIRIDRSNAETIFGANVSDAYERMNLMKGFYEITSAMPNTEIIAVRVGPAKKARLDLFEMQLASGIYAPQPTDTVSVALEALAEGNDGNSITCDVYGTAQGIPTKAIIGLPTGTAVEFDLINTYKTPSALAAAINANTEVSKFVKATPNVLTETENITIVADDVVSGQIETIYQLSQRNLIDLTAVYLSGEFIDSDSIPAGRSSATLAKTPIKDGSVYTDTISKFWTVVLNEVLSDGTAPDTTTLNLVTAQRDARWTRGLADSVKDVVISAKSPVTGATIVASLGTDVSVDVSTGEAVFTANTEFLDRLYGDNAGNHDSLPTGTIVTASYKYLTSYDEANVRSALEIGNPYSYFVGGDVITFGASQGRPLEVAYQTKAQFAIPGDVTIADPTTGTIRFKINERAPKLGDSVTFEYLFEPELPAPNGTLLPSGKRAASQLSGGTDGRRMSLAEYYNELAKGYIGADNIPCSLVVPQGVYLDSVIDGIDFETGLPTTMNAGFHTQLSAFLARHSQYVSECRGIISVRPMVTANPASPSLEEREAWYNNLVNVSTTDTTRAANVISSINDYHLVVVVGDLIMVHPAINNGRPYVEGAANIFAAMKYHHDNLTSIVTREVPMTSIVGLQYKIQNMDRINAINAMRYTLITEDSDTGQLKAAAAPTLAAPTSQFRKQYNLDITIEAVNNVRRALKPFIGKPNTASTRLQMEKVAKQRLQEMTPDKLIGAEVRVVASRTEAINGSCQVQLVLVTAVELTQISITTRLQLGF